MMEPVQSSLRKWMHTNKNFKEQYLKISKEVLQDTEIKQFLSANPELTKQDISRNMMKLYEYKSQSKQCASCTNFDACNNMLKGYTPSLRVEDNDIYLSYEKCHLHLQEEERKKQTQLIKSLYMPKDILHATFKDIEPTSEREQVQLEIFEFIRQAKDGIPEKGFYFYGPFGVGKTYFLGALANALKKFNISSTIIYMPELVREMRSSLKDDSVNEKIDFLKKADILMLDDIGAEMQSAWFRDEILGSILQFRMMEKLPVFFTSNYSLLQLEKMLSETKSGIETVKAGRIIERIKQVSKEIKVTGENRRN